MKPSCIKDSAHPALFTAVRWPKASTPKREHLLKLVTDAVDWPALEETTRPYYQADVRRTGRRGYSLSMMLRCHVLQLLWRMSARQAEHAIMDSHAFAVFVGTDAWAPRPPSATAMRTFRTLLAGNMTSLGDTLDALVERRLRDDLAAAGLEFRPGRIEDPVFRRITA